MTSANPRPYRWPPTWFKDLLARIAGPVHLFSLLRRGSGNVGVQLRSPTMKPPPVAYSIRLRTHFPWRPCFGYAGARMS